MKIYHERSSLVQEKSTNHLGGFNQTYFTYYLEDTPVKMPYILLLMVKLRKRSFTPMSMIMQDGF